MGKVLVELVLCCKIRKLLFCADFFIAKRKVGLCKVAVGNHDDLIEYVSYVSINLCYVYK